MKNLIKTSLSVFCLFACLAVSAQPKSYTTANVHSHNDYLNSEPFERAYRNDFGSIEADIYPVNGVLFVAHSKREVKPNLTLKGLYINPLLKKLSENKTRKLKLLIDIKENYKQSLDLLVQDLEPLKKYLSTPQKSGQVTILISGTRPPPSEYKNYPDYILFDNDQSLPHNATEWKRVGLVSLTFQKFTAWKGVGPLDPAEQKKIKFTIDSVHHANKTIRFWAAPDTEASWLKQMELGVDLIGTDLVDELGSFLRNREKKK
ncbi:MAG TPA: alkaline phosphatase [Sphingobacteriaceae bacterium]|nr:alkaline phosphatase [Sphingobacteriaceae bacterium]